MTQPSTASDDQRFMRMALDACRAGIDAGQSPFGACIVDGDGGVIACEHNTVWQSTDPTAHAEVHAIRCACGQVGKIHLKGATIYSTTEPCPMCFAAIHWARIGRIVFAASIEDAARFGFNELPVSNQTLCELGQVGVEVVPHFMRRQAIELYEYWRQNKGKAY